MSSVLAVTRHLRGDGIISIVQDRWGDRRWSAFPRSAWDAFRSICELVAPRILPSTPRGAVLLTSLTCRTIAGIRGAMTPTARHRTTTVAIHAATDSPGVVATTPVSIVDHATGCGAALARQLASEFTGDVLSGYSLDGLEVHLRPSTSPSLVDVSGPWGDDWHVPLTYLGDLVLSRLTRIALDAERCHVVLHAGAVVDPVGDALLLLGVSGSGKSTLVTSMVSAGLTLLNDEQVTLYGGASRIGATTRRIVLKPGSLARFGTFEPDTSAGPVLVPASRFGSATCIEARPRLAVAIDRLGPGALPDAFDSRVLPADEAFEVLCQNNLNLPRFPRAGLEALCSLACSVPMLSARYSDAAVAAARLTEAMAEPPGPLEVGWHVVSMAPGSGDPAAHEAPLLVRIGAVDMIFDPLTLRLARVDGLRELVEVDDYVEHLVAAIRSGAVADKPRWLGAGQVASSPTSQPYLGRGLSVGYRPDTPVDDASSRPFPAASASWSWRRGSA